MTLLCFAEAVSPREGMADRIVRHFERMRAPRAKRVAVRWPDGATILEVEVETDKGETIRKEWAFPAATPTPSPDGLNP